MELAIAAAGLCLAWQGLERRSLSILAATAVPIFFTVSMVITVRQGFAIGRDDPSGVLILTLLIWFFWLGIILNEGTNLFFFLFGPRHSQGGMLLRKIGVLFGILALLLAVATATLALGQWFVSQNVFHPLPTNLLAILMGLGLITGSILIAITLFGSITGLMSHDPRSQVLTRLRSAALWLEAALVLRALTIGSAFYVASFSCPFGAHYFINRYFSADSNLITVRLFLGLLLPMLFGWLAFLPPRDQDHERIAAQFVPITIIVIIGEILAVGLTVAMSGISF